tara:strand:+ start:4925 stop:5188 length:264 start_codon:yes stop_codon:yes gene_type:complete
LIGPGIFLRATKLNHDASAYLIAKFQRVGKGIFFIKDSAATVYAAHTIWPPCPVLCLTKANRSPVDDRATPGDEVDAYRGQYSVQQI